MDQSLLNSGWRFDWQWDFDRPYPTGQCILNAHPERSRLHRHINFLMYAQPARHYSLIFSGVRSLTARFAMLVRTVPSSLNDVTMTFITP